MYPQQFVLEHAVFNFEVCGMPEARARKLGRSMSRQSVILPFTVSGRDALIMRRGLTHLVPVVGTHFKATQSLDSDHVFSQYPETLSMRLNMTGNAFNPPIRHHKIQAASQSSCVSRRPDYF